MTSGMGLYPTSLRVLCLVSTNSSDVLPTAYHSIIDVLSKPEQKVEHEQLSLLFSLMIYHDLRKQGKVDDEINIENVLKIIEKDTVTNRSLRKLMERQQISCR